MTEIDFGKKKSVSGGYTSPLDGPGPAPDPAWFEQPDGEPPFARYVLTTPLHLVAASESRTNAWTDWAGYTVASVYTNVEQEYDALRTRAGLSDISPLVKYRISGKEAVAYLDRLTTRSCAAMKADSALRSVICAGDGNIVTEGLLFRLGETEFRFVGRSPHLDWLLEAAEGFEVHVEDVSGTIAALSLAGPLAADVLVAAGFADAPGLEPGRALWAEPGRMPVYVSRTGMLGGLEFELWIDPEDAPILWRRLLDAGTPFGLAPVGMDVRDIARLENGVALEGIDYTGAFDALEADAMCSPYDLGLGDRVDLERPCFNGQQALARIERKGACHLLAGLEIDAAPDAGLSDVFTGGERKVGRITSSAWSPALQRHVALAIVEAAAFGTSGDFSVRVGGRHVPARSIKRPFLQFSAKNPD